MALAFHSGFSQLFTFAPDYFLRILTFILLGIFCPRPAPLRGAPRACSWRGNGMRWSATMPGSRRLRGLRSLKAHGAHTPATRADGPSAGPGDSSHERGASAVATNPGTGSKPQNPSCAERRRILLPWRARPGNGLGPGPYAACEAACGSPCVDCEKAYGRSHANAGAAGAAIRPVVPHSPSGANGRQREGNDEAASPVAEMNTGR